MMSMRSGWRLVARTFAACIILTLGGSPSDAQDARGLIEGRVVDESGGVLPGAAVAATHTATGVVALAVTNVDGRYQLPLLQPGMYRVVVELQGFRRVERDRVEVRVDDRVVLDVTLTVGHVAETVTVTAETPLLEAGSGSAGQVIDQKRLELMPLSDGNPFTLIRLAGGIVPFGNLEYFRPFDNNATAEFSSSGAPTSNAYTIDGAPNNTHQGGRRGQPDGVYASGGRYPGVQGRDLDVRCGPWARGRRDGQRGDAKRHEHDQRGHLLLLSRRGAGGERVLPQAPRRAGDAAGLQPPRVHPRRTRATWPVVQRQEPDVLLLGCRVALRQIPGRHPADGSDREAAERRLLGAAVAGHPHLRSRDRVHQCDRPCRAAGVPRQRHPGRSHQPDGT